MRKKHTKIWKSIEESCRKKCWDVETIYKRAELILNSYREVCWKTRARAEEVRAELSSFSSKELEDALIYLETFAPEKERDCFQNKVESLFETKALVEMVDTAMIRVKEYPGRGDEFFDILSLKYLDRYRYTGKDVWEILNMERSVYYDKKKDAILVFAYAFWETALPKYRKAILPEIDDEEDFLESELW